MPNIALASASVPLMTTISASASQVAISSTKKKVLKPRSFNLPHDKKVRHFDPRLPPNWHRKVSQRKSGVSAGRYEVFIIGPTGKRFRSRNEIKAYFDKTGETVLKPEQFDFSPCGAVDVNNQESTTCTSSTVSSVSETSSTKQSELENLKTKHAFDDIEQETNELKRSKMLDSKRQYVKMSLDSGSGTFLKRLLTS